MTLDPNSIIVKNRQRKTVEVDEHFIASIRKCLIQPIVLRRVDGEPHLVVGGRRLTALQAIGEPLTEHVHFRFIEDLDEFDARVAELEENIKREDLSWRDHAAAVAEIHQAFRAHHGPQWTALKTMEALAVSERWLHLCLIVAKNLDSPLLRDANGIEHAHSILRLVAERRAGQILSDISNTGRQIFAPEASEADPNANDPLLQGPAPQPNGSGVSGSQDPQHAPVSDRPSPSPAPAEDRGPILAANFLEWAPTYVGPKFNVIHVDFPYNVEYKSYAQSTNNTEEDYESRGYWELLDTFVTHLDRFCSYSSHVMFWFSMEFYEKTRTILEGAGLFVHRHPLVWFKSDNSGIIPGRDNQYPRRVYETALLCSRSKRPLVKTLANAYAAPLPSHAIHPSQKSEPMLRHFLSMLVDETTDMLDPTAGSGAAVNAAESLGARRTLGLEINPDYVARANTNILQSRQLRNLKL